MILGLAVSDLAMSLHRLLGAGDRVKWDYLAPLAAVLAFLKIVTQWWSWYGAADLAKNLTFGMFIGVLTATILLFLMTAAALPDVADEPVVDLRAYYAGVSRRYWLLFAGHWTLMNAITVWAEMRIEGAHLSLLSPLYLIVPVALSLAFLRNRWWHAICLIAFSGFYITQLFGHELS